MWNVRPSCWGSVPLGPNFTGTRSSPAKMLIPFDRLIALKLYRWEFLDKMKLCSIFCRNFCEKGKFGYLNAILRTLGVTLERPDISCMMARWKAHGQLSIVNWTFFAIYYGSRVRRQNVNSSAVFTGGQPLCTQILPGQGHPQQPFLASEN